MARDAWLGWSKALWRRFGAVALSVVGIPLALNGLVDLSLTTGFTGMTALLLLAYTLETHEMRRQMVLANEIAIQPLVIATIEYRPVESEGLAHAGAKQVVLRNIGRGPALFVQVRDLTLTDPAGDRVRFVAKFDPVDYLEPEREKVPTVAECRGIDVPVPEAQVAPVPCLEPSTAVDDYDVTISYEDIGRQRRESHMRMGKGGIRFLGQKKV